MPDPAPKQQPDWLAALLLQPGNSLAAKLTTGAARLLALPRGLRRRLGKGASAVAGVGLLVALGGGLLFARPNVYAAGITADGTTCTLANAIKSANTDSAVGGCAAGAGDDLITLTADVALTAPFGIVNGEDTGLPAITTTLTIAGNGHTIARDPSAVPFRILVVDKATATLSSLTISGGAGAYGGGILNHRGTLTLNDVTLSGNTADSGGGLRQYRGTTTLNATTLTGNTAGNGAGLYAYRGTVNITGSSITNNNAPDGAGGGLVVYYKSVATISGSTISGNTAATGGGIYSNASDLTVTGSTISGNTADTGGGLYGYAGQVQLATSTLSGNAATYGGGGIYTYGSALVVSRSTLSGNSAGYGGGIYNLGSSFEGLTLANSTVSNNSANYQGGGLLNAGTAELINATVTGNNAGDDVGETAGQAGGGVANGEGGVLSLARSLISGNTVTGDGAEVAILGGAVSSNGYNVFSHSGQTTAAAIGALTLDPSDANASSDATNVALAAILSAALANNGGPTTTHALPAGSPAIDRAPSDNCAAYPTDNIDQRGLPRNLDGNAADTLNECDAGAFEFDPSAPTATPTPTPSPTQEPTVTGTPPTATPTTTPTPTVTGTPPTATPTVTVMPTSTVTPSPTALPSATPSPSPTVQPESYTLFLPALFTPEG